MPAGSLLPTWGKAWRLGVTSQPHSDTDSEQQHGGGPGAAGPSLGQTSSLGWGQVGAEGRRPVLPGVPWASGPGRAEQLQEVPGPGGPPCH